MKPIDWLYGYGGSPEITPAIIANAILRKYIFLLTDSSICTGGVFGGGVWIEGIYDHLRYHGINE